MVTSGQLFRTINFQQHMKQPPGQLNRGVRFAIDETQILSESELAGVGGGV